MGQLGNESLTSLRAVLWHVAPHYNLYHEQHDCCCPPDAMGSSQVAAKEKFIETRWKSCVPALMEFYKIRVWRNSFNKLHEECPALQLGDAEWCEVGETAAVLENLWCTQICRWKINVDLLVVFLIPTPGRAISFYFLMFALSLNINLSAVLGIKSQHKTQLYKHSSEHKGKLLIISGMNMFL